MPGLWIMGRNFCAIGHFRRQNAIVTNAPVRRPGSGASAPCCRHRRTHRHRARRLLQAALIPHRQGQGGHRHGPQDRSAVLQRRASWNGILRSRSVVVRDTLPHASGQQSAPACQGIRLCSPAHRAKSWCCRFLGIVQPSKKTFSTASVTSVDFDWWSPRPLIPTLRPKKPTCSTSLLCQKETNGVATKALLACSINIGAVGAHDQREGCARQFDLGLLPEIERLLTQVRKTLAYIGGKLLRGD